MNSKLTPEQLEAIRKKLSYCWLVHSEEDEDRYQVFDYFLSINTAEDEPCSECGGNGFIWNNMGLPVDCPKCMMLSNFEGVDG